jgi:hypothetical protein
VALSPTITTEYHDGSPSSEWDDGHTIWLDWHNPWAVTTPLPVDLTSLSTIWPDGTEVAFTADVLSKVVCYPHKLISRYHYLPRGYRNIKVVYTHGYVTPPADIVTAALLACIQELVPSSIPSSVIDGSDGNIKWSRVKDPERGRWYGNEAIDAVLREHRAFEKAVAFA